MLKNSKTALLSVLSLNSLYKKIKEENPELEDKEIISLMYRKINECDIEKRKTGKKWYKWTKVDII
ncbi:MAG: hypothetical protein JW827_03480 [Spirochaetes bacterium]|nr:hypothetical protein [Spirochaetota bacterium]